MDIIPGLLTETEFRFFDSDTYEALTAVASDIVCDQINQYIDSPDADSAIVDALEAHMGDILSRFRLNKRIIDEKVIDYIDSLVPETLAQQDVDYQQIIDKLQFLEDNYTSIVINVTPSKKQDYENFVSAIFKVTCSMRSQGVNTTYPDLVSAIEDNKFIFYTPGQKTRTTKVNRVLSTRRKWTMALNGSRYLLYCQEHDIDAAERRRF